MGDKVNVILDLSDEVQTLLEQQDVNLYQELQQAVPSLFISENTIPRRLKAVVMLFRYFKLCLL
jgi:hypothetical protein